MYDLIRTISTVLVMAVGAFFFLEARYVHVSDLKDNASELGRTITLDLKEELKNNRVLAKAVADSLAKDETFQRAVTGVPGPPGKTLPIGSILPFSGPMEKIPENWWPCDGRQVAIQAAPELYQVIGIGWGGQREAFFHIPDLRGRFLRGIDQGSGHDPDADARIAINQNGNRGDRVGSLQLSATQLPNQPFVLEKDIDHQHQAPVQDKQTETQALAPVESKASADAKHGKQVTLTALDSQHHHTLVGGDAETRPTNAYVYFIIKYK